MYTSLYHVLVSSKSRRRQFGNFSRSSEAAFTLKNGPEVVVGLRPPFRTTNWGWYDPCSWLHWRRLVCPYVQLQALTQQPAKHALSDLQLLHRVVPNSGLLGKHWSDEAPHDRYHARFAVDFVCGFGLATISSGRPSSLLGFWGVNPTISKVNHKQFTFDDGPRRRFPAY